MNIDNKNQEFEQKKQKDKKIKSENKHDIKKEKEKGNELIIAKLKEEIKQHKNILMDLKLRSQAEIENIRRRTNIDIEKAHKYSLEKIINELLPIIDSLEKSLELSHKTSDSIIKEGIKLTLKSLLNTVKKFGLQVIEDTNIPFNPDIHQAMSVIKSVNTNIASNHVVMVVQKGYMLNGRLLRPAMVTVSEINN